MMAMLEVVKLTRVFGGVRAVDGLTFHVGAGEFVGLIGPNGAGKSTAFNLINGVVPPSSGIIRYGGENLAGLRPNQIVRRGIARTFQASTVFTTSSVRENIQRGAYLWSPQGFVEGFFSTRVARAKIRKVEQYVDELLELLSLAPYQHKQAGSLPYGHQRRLGVAIALATDPTLLMLDEPAAGLNEEEAAEMGDLFQSINSTRGISIVLVEHHMRMLMRVCQKVVVLDHGVKIAEGTPFQVQDDPVVIRAYLGSFEERQDA